MKSLVLVLLSIKCIAGVARDNPVVNTPKGQIRGLHAQDGDYDMFLGIPYAVVDEKNPFGASKEHTGFNVTFDAYHDGVQCIQENGHIVSGTIHCLQLNVYVPHSASPTKKLPVIFYIHGGAFIRGHKGLANLSPRFLIRHDVIIVSINYRLGPYGFVCVSEPGFNNQGLRDQLIALKWVKENIAAFGGDVKTLTLMGQSAGAMSIDVLLLVKEKLADRVILHSGPALTTWMISSQNDTLPTQWAEALGFEGKGIKSAMEFLSNANPIEVMKVAAKYNKLHPATRPCVEKAGKDAILTDFPVNMKPYVKGMDIMIGHANKEVMFLYPDSDEEFYKNYDFGLELFLDFDAPHNEDIVKHFYIGDKKPSINLRNEILDFGSDFGVVHPTEQTIDRYFASDVNSVYRFVFSYEGGRNRNKVRLNLTADGASHGDDLGYIFDMTLFKDQEISEDDQIVIDVMTKMWTDFAKYGNPSPSSSSPLQWRPIDEDNRYFLNITKAISLGSRPFYDRMAFWNLFYKWNRKNVRGYRP